ncbi:lipoate--protein ligase family protein [Geoalkalibacter halelectricus]|uniref:lipoate--protein ligase family protein n=1 Tax=Geoalkalibacter halelectricus TaxID=2847045 RepID=UPI003D2279B5
MPGWRLIRTAPASGAWNMAVDEALLESVAAGVSPPVLRLYRWQPATVSLGYGQRGADQVNLMACRRRGIDLVRRITGGRAVLHDRELTYAVVASHQGGLFSGGILENYRVIARPLLALFSRLGIDGELVTGKPRGAVVEVAPNVCFTAPSTYEIVHAGCKLTGGAQKIQDSAFLQHGSIPLDLDLELLWELLNSTDVTRKAAGLRHLEHSVGWINRWCRPAVDIETLESLFIEVFAATLDLVFTADDLSAGEQRRARQLTHSRYGCDDWNLRGIPAENSDEPQSS